MDLYLTVLPVVNLVLDFRSLSKIANTYIAGLKPFLITHQNPQAFCPTVSAVVSLGNVNLPLAIPLWHSFTPSSYRTLPSYHVNHFIDTTILTLSFIHH